MWVVRALLQLVSRIAVAVLVAIVIAEVRALLDGGDTMHTFRVVLLLLGGLFLLLGASGTGSAASRRIGWGEVTAGRGGVVFRAFQPRPDERQLSAGAVFIGSGIVLLVLGAVI
jgi:hypothetical protein